jgi:glycosyltransferase involved in cell wall biosynthesis
MEPQVLPTVFPMSQKLLIISYLFPPVGGIGVQRALSMAKYLPRHGFDVHVLKASNAGGPVRDTLLIQQIPSEVHVHEAFTPEIPFVIRQKLWTRFMGRSGPAKADGGQSAGGWKSLLRNAVTRVLCPEPEILWVPFAVRKARRIIQRYGIDSVLITVPPFSALVVGTKLKREFPSLRLISDFRDEWLTFYLKDFDFQKNDHTRRRAEAIERETVELSDLVVAVNESSRDEIRRRYPEQPDSKFSVIPNGYDPAVFADFKPRVNRSPRMLVTHVGTVYKTASPRFYLDAADSLPEELLSQLETRFVGRIADSERPMLENRRSKVSITEFVPQAEALKYMEDTDYLLLTMTNDISVPGKLFEYMATGKPILAITSPGSEVDRLLQQTGAGVSAPAGDRDAIRNMLRLAIDAWRNGSKLTEQRASAVARYERPRLVEEYGALIRSTRTRQPQAINA